MSQPILPVRPPQIARAWTRFQKSLEMDEDHMASLPETEAESEPETEAESEPETEAETEAESEPETDPWKDWEDYYGPGEDQIERQLNEELDKQFRDQLDLVYIMDN